MLVERFSANEVTCRHVRVHLVWLNSLLSQLRNLCSCRGHFTANGNFLFRFGNTLSWLRAGKLITRVSAFPHARRCEKCILLFLCLSMNTQSASCNFSASFGAELFCRHSTRRFLIDTNLLLRCELCPEIASPRECSIRLSEFRFYQDKSTTESSIHILTSFNQTFSLCIDQESSFSLQSNLLNDAEHS